MFQILISERVRPVDWATLKSAKTAPFICSANSGLTDKPQSNLAFWSVAPIKISANLS